MSTTTNEAGTNQSSDRLVLHTTSTKKSIIPTAKKQSFHRHQINQQEIPHIDHTADFLLLERFYGQNQPTNAFFSILGSLGRRGEQHFHPEPHVLS